MVLLVALNQHCFCLRTVLGAWIFSNSETSTGLVAGRLLIGLGVSSLDGSLQGLCNLVQSERLPMINGLQMVAGGLGALGATTPLQNLLSVIGVDVFSVLSIITVLLHCVYGLFFLNIIVRQKKNLNLKHS